MRDLVLTGRTLDALGVVSSKANEARIGFNNPRAAAIAYFNQQKDPAFWFSPNDQGKIGQFVREEIMNGEALIKTSERSAA